MLGEGWGLSPLGAIRVKGHSQEVEAFRLLALRG